MPNQDWDEDDAIDGAEDAAEDEGDGNSSDYAVLRDEDEAIGGGKKPSRVAVNQREEEASTENEGGGLWGAVGGVLSGLFGQGDNTAKAEEEEEASEDEESEEEEYEEEVAEDESEDEEESEDDEEEESEEEVAEDEEDSEEGEEWATVVVKAGDTLSKIAKRELGDASRWPEIFEANSDTLDNPDEIYPGQELWIPAE